jgi:hypothetical protein
MVVDQQLEVMQASATALATSPSLILGDLAAFHRQAQAVVHDYPDAALTLELKRIAHITRQSLGFYRESNAPALT